MQELRDILLQDSVILRKKFPNLYYWQHEVFNCPEYIQYSTTLEAAIQENGPATAADHRLSDIVPDLQEVVGVRDEVWFAGVVRRCGTKVWYEAFFSHLFTHRYPLLILVTNTIRCSATCGECGEG
jgi:hypothetical protein